MTDMPINTGRQWTALDVMDISDVSGVDRSTVVKVLEAIQYVERPTPHFVLKCESFTGKLVQQANDKLRASLPQNIKRRARDRRRRGVTPPTH